MSPGPAIEGATFAPGRRDSGFSLIEVIVSLAILSAILAALPSTFGLARRAWAAVATIEQRESWAASRSFLEQRLAEAVPLLVTDGNSNRRSAFAGEAARLSFVATSASGPAGGGLYHWSISAETSAGGRALVLRHGLIASGRVIQRSTETRILLDGIEDLRLRYFGATDETAERRWSDAWSDDARLPELVELTISTVMDGRAPESRQIVVPLRLRRP